MIEQLPPPPGDADESRVASLRASLARIRPQPHLGPGGQTGWQLAMPDVLYLLDLAEEALRRRREEERLRAALAGLVAVAGEFSYNRAGPLWDDLCAALAEARKPV